MWSSQQSPGDVRTLVASQMVVDNAGAVFFTDRAKTGKPVGGALSNRALAAVEAYVKVLGVQLHGDARSSATAVVCRIPAIPLVTTSATSGISNSAMMKVALWLTSARSGTQEAFAGDAKPADVSHAMGNIIATSNMLFATYNPVNLASVRKVHEARIKGRRMLREGGRKIRPALGQRLTEERNEAEKP